MSFETIPETLVRVSCSGALLVQAFLIQAFLIQAFLI